MKRSSKDYDPHGLLGREMTTVPGSGHIEVRSVLPDWEILAAACPGTLPDSGVAETVGRLLNWSEGRIDRAISDGLREGYFRPE